MTRATEKAKKPIDVEAIFKAAADEARKADRARVEAKHDEATVTKRKKKGPKMQDLARAGGGQSTVAPGPKIKINK
tara:strand:- start:288 stop:515 length:228 start_codon:yes stop_codon:yes gene_type:complete